MANTSLSTLLLLLVISPMALTTSKTGAEVPSFTAFVSEVASHAPTYDQLTAAQKVKHNDMKAESLQLRTKLVIDSNVPLLALTKPFDALTYSQKQAVREEYIKILKRQWELQRDLSKLLTPSATVSSLILPPSGGSSKRYITQPSTTVFCTSSLCQVRHRLH